MYRMGSFNKQQIQDRISMCDYLSVAQLFLQDNFFLERPLTFDDVKPRLLGHWGTCHGINLTYANLKSFFKNDPNFSFILGPGHGFPALQANLFLDGDLVKVDPQATIDANGVAYLCKNFSWPDGFPSHASPLTPGVICEGGELGYALGAAFGACLGHPEKTIAVLIGDGEFETATTLSSLNLVKLFGTPEESRNRNQKLRSRSDNGLVIPILHLNSYKITGPTISGRKSDRELLEQLRGFGYNPVIIDGENIISFQVNLANLPENPFIIMRSEKGATGPSAVDGQKIAGNFLAHQIPLKNAKTDSNQLKILETWLQSYDFQRKFTIFRPEKAEKVTETPKITQNHALPTSDYLQFMPDFVEHPGQDLFSPAKQFGNLLKLEMKNDPSLYLFSPDETTSNKLDATYQVTARAWAMRREIWDMPESTDGRIVELLSENTLFAALIGHILNNREQAFMTSYESFFTIITSQILQHLKFLKQAESSPWRHDPYPSVNLLSTSTCWRQDHNGFSHQSPALISSLLSTPNPRVNCLFPVDDVAATAAFDFMLSSDNVVNLTTFDKNDNPRWIDKNHARFQLENGGASIFGFTSDDNPDFVFTAAGDIVARESIAAIHLLKQDLPYLKFRFVGIASLTSAPIDESSSTGAIGTSRNRFSRDQFADYFTPDKQIIANFHGYAGTLRNILSNYTSPARIHAHGFSEEGSTTTPFEMLTLNHASRYDLAIDVAKICGRSDLVDKYQGIIDQNHAHTKSTGLDLPGPPL